MSANIGKVERVFRLIVGGMILGLYGALAEPWRYLALIVGLPLVGSAITGFCPIRAALDRGRV